MKNLTLLIFLIGIILLGCTERKSSSPEIVKIKISNGQTKTSYPEIVDSLGLNDIYDSARWWTYCINCDDTCVFYSPIKSKAAVITFGQAELRYDKESIHNDTLIDFSFDFYYDSVKCFHFENYRPFASFGIQYNIITKKPTAVMIYGGLTYLVIFRIPTESKNRYFYPLQPEVITYINQNKTKLDPWFYQEATRKGLIKD